MSIYRAKRIGSNEEVTGAFFHRERNRIYSEWNDVDEDTVEKRIDGGWEPVRPKRNLLEDETIPLTEEELREFVSLNFAISTDDEILEKISVEKNHIVGWYYGRASWDKELLVLRHKSQISKYKAILWLAERFNLEED